MAERVGLSSTDLPDARNPINKGLSAAGENRCVPPVCTTFRGLRQASWLSWRPAVAAAQQDDGLWRHGAKPRVRLLQPSVRFAPEPAVRHGPRRLFGIRLGSPQCPIARRDDRFADRGLARERFVYCGEQRGLAKRLEQTVDGAISHHAGHDHFVSLSRNENENDWQI